MNRIIMGSLCLLLILSCKHKPGNKQSEEDKTAEKKITVRDYSIDKANAYTGIFLDSLSMEGFIATGHLNDTLTRRMRSFYNARNYQFAWFTGNGLTEQGRSFWNLHEYYTTYVRDTALRDHALKRKMNKLVTQDTFKVSDTDKLIVQTELTLTKHFISYLLANYKAGEIKRKEAERFVPLKKQHVMAFADSLLTKKHKDNKYYSDVNEPYRLLNEQLKKYYGIAKNNGWQPITYKGKNLKNGMAAPAVIAIKRRLQITGHMPAGDTTDQFDIALQTAVQAYQACNGYTPSGIVTQALINDMNVPAQKRLEQILINMDRMRWVLNHQQGNLVLVNIPEFMLHVMEGKKKVFDMPVVVGKEGHNTTIFTGNMNQIVFSPYWNITPNIIAKEIWPAMKKDPGYLARNNMEQTGVDEDGLPVIRQMPGEKNSLGKVKFLFPNSFDIYFHDTPAKELFNKERRAYSHGCIRLSDPVKMANYLLRNNKDWNTEKIDSAMNSDSEKVVWLKKPIPVLITYYTAWVDEGGLLHFREDVYGHDAMLIKRMFIDP